MVDTTVDVSTATNTSKDWIDNQSLKVSVFVWNAAATLSVASNFIDFASLLKQDSASYVNTTALKLMIISERVLSKEWNTPEEDMAWADL